MNVLKSKNCSIVADNLVSQLMIWHIVSMKKKEDAPVYRRLSRGRKKGENLTLSIKKESTEHFTEIERFGSCEEPNTVATVKEQHANLTPNLTQTLYGARLFLWSVHWVASVRQLSGQIRKPIPASFQI